MYNLNENQNYSIFHIEKLSKQTELKHQSEALMQAAVQIARIAEHLTNETVRTEPKPEKNSDWIEIASKAYEFRRHRVEVFSDIHIACGPAWDILLDLFINHQRGRKVATGDACIAASCPHTTALRWIDVLVFDGLVTKSPDPTDARRSFVYLTADGIGKMHKALAGQNT